MPRRHAGAAARRTSSLALQLALTLGVVLSACTSSPPAAVAEYTEPCATDADCVSGRCLPGSNGDGFCSKECGVDVDCVSDESLFCCERLGEKAYCTQPPGNVCRQAALGDGCQGDGDPFCTRANLICANVGDRNTCTIECTTSADCSDVRGAVCAEVAGRTVCVAPDSENLPRLESNCAGDRDCPTAGETCQFFLDNELDPRAFVTLCSDTVYGERKAYAACDASEQCDRFFCIDGFCPAMCFNDSHCAPGFRCEPIPVLVPNETATTQPVSVLGLCRVQRGSYRPCDSALSSCPVGEACRFVGRDDGGSTPACADGPRTTQTAPPLAAAFGTLGQPCSTRNDEGAFNAVDGEIKLCASGLCMADGYCSAPCAQSSDCAGGGDMVCVFEPFAPHCERRDLATGTDTGQACSASSQSGGDAQCKTQFCDGNTATCAARKAAGSACARSNECESFACLRGKCAALCRDDLLCTGGATEQVCSSILQAFDRFGTNSTADDPLDTPAFCTELAGAARTSCGDAACPVVGCPGTCPDGTICHAVLTREGNHRGVCAAPAAGLAVGEACQRDDQCQTQLCLGFTATTGRCSTVCDTDAQCGGDTKCLSVTLTGLGLDKLCVTPPGNKTQGQPCAENDECGSFLCVEGQCAALCASGTALGTACGDGLACARTPVPLDAKFTEEAFDDRYGFVSACVSGAVPFSGDLGACAAPRRFIARPIAAGDGLAVACATPIPTTLSDGTPCSAATQCQAGLCVDNRCAAVCVAGASDSCGSDRKCDVSAPALLGDNNGVTARTAACRAPCSANSDCGEGRMCEPESAPGAPRFCRIACTEDRDCAAGESCGADPGNGDPRRCVTTP